VLEWLLKYEPGLFRRGTLELAWPWWAYLAALLGFAALVAWALGYARFEAHMRPVDRAVLGGVRTALLAVLLLTLLGPVLVVDTDEPTRGAVVVLLDDSLSMRVSDVDGQSRADFVRHHFAPGSGTISSRLDTRFDVRYFAFSGAIEPLGPGRDLTFSGPRGDLAGALTRIMRQGAARSVAAVVLVSDGGFERGPELDGALLELRASGVPLHGVGIGRARFETDLEIADVRLPGGVLRGDTVEAVAVLRQRGLADRTVELVVEEESVIVADRKLTLPADGGLVRVSIPITFDTSGPRRLTFRTDVAPGEQLADNNLLTRTVSVRDHRIEVLHFEGEPRFEVKFLRRAVADDDNIRLVSLVRTAENKYYRLGVEDPSELAAGFPDSEADLFRYDAIVIGSVEAALLSADQQAALRAFVERRGGGLLFLGGRHAFAEGGYADAPLAGLMPVVLAGRATEFRQRVRVGPTAAGLRDPVLRLDPKAESDVWQRLPKLTVLNPIRALKPGATALLEGLDQSGDPLVLLATQRYGRGTVAAFPVHNTWRWQMHVDVPPDDLTHEILWRQMLRWLARPAGDRLQIRVRPAHAVPGQSVVAEVEAYDAQYLPMDEAELKVSLTSPLGRVSEYPLTRSAEEPGVYQVRLPVADTGRYDLEVDASVDGLPPVSASVRVSADGQEFFGAELDRAGLSSLAAGTGGQYFAGDQAGNVIAAIDDTVAVRSVVRRLPLWDMPALLLALLILLCGEWLYRRRCAIA